jgi:hypothetical protein
MAMHAFRPAISALALWLALGVSSGAKAAPIGPGFDLDANGISSPLTIQRPSSSSATTQGDGVSIVGTRPGNTDTIIQRTGSLADGTMGTTGSGIQPSEMHALPPAYDAWPLKRVRPLHWDEER